MSELEPTGTELEPTVTERLRALLDEHGVEWRDDSSIYGTRRTVWKVDGVTFVAAEVSGRLKVSGYLTPEQAIAATLDSCNCSNNCTNAERTETCQMEYVSDWMSWHCKACDQMDMAPRNPKPRYCKWCGRKVVDA